MSLDNAATAADTTPTAGVPEAAGVETTERQARRRETPRSVVDWKPDDGVTKIDREIELYSPLLRRNINRMGMRAQLSLYLLQRVLPSSGMVDEAQRFQATFDEKMSALEGAIEQAQEELTAICKRVGIDKNPPRSSTKPLTMTIPVYSQGMNRFIQVVLKLDNYYCRLDYVWMNSAISTQTQWEKINHFRRALWNEITFVGQSWTHARAVLRDHQNGRRTARAMRDGQEATESAAA